MSTVTVIDHLLWPAIARRWLYVVMLIVLWALELPLIELGLVIDHIGGLVLISIGTLGIVAGLWLIVESRERLIIWRNLEMSRRGR